MKRLIMTAAVAAFMLSAGAQNRITADEVRDVCNVALRGSDTRVTDKDVIVGNMYYYRPEGFFYSGYASDLYSNYKAYMPINGKMVFKADYNTGTPVWEYPSGKWNADGSPEIITAAGESVEVMLPKGTFPAPKLINGDDDGDSFMASAEVEAGGFTYDARAVNYVPEGIVNTSSFYFNTNDSESGNRLGEFINRDNVMLKGFGELFSSPAKMKIYGFAILIKGDVMNDADRLKPSFLLRKGDVLTELKGAADFNVIVTDIFGTGNMLHVMFTLRDGAIDVEGGNDIIAAVKTDDLVFTPMFVPQTRWNASADNCTTMFVNTDDGDFIQLPGFETLDDDNKTRYINSWCISLDMSYEDSDMSGIDAVTAEKKNKANGVYSISGAKVSSRNTTDNLTNGVYVIDGKKVSVKN